MLPIVLDFFVLLQLIPFVIYLTSFAKSPPAFRYGSRGCDTLGS